MDLDALVACECGCGEPAPIATYTSAKHGYVKGQQVRFVRGHHRRVQKGRREDRFWERVDKCGPGDCWGWRGATNADGYGAFCEQRGQRVGAHRVAYEIAHGPIPEGEGYHGICVCHTCDNPGCVNPAHLFLGTVADNNHDRSAKGRTAAPSAKLTPDAVRLIRSEPRVRGYRAKLAEKFGVSPHTISGVVAGRTWEGVA